MGVHLLWATVSGNSRLQLPTVDARPLLSPVVTRNTLKRNTLRLSVLRLKSTGKVMGVHLLWETVSGNFPLTVVHSRCTPITFPVGVQTQHTQTQHAIACCV